MLTRFWPFDTKDTSWDNEQLLSTVFESTTDPLAIYDRNYRLIKINLAFANLYQIPGKKLIGKCCYEVIFNRTEKCHGCRIGEIFITEEQKSWEEERILPNGLKLSFEVFASPIRNRKGITTLAFQQRRDITEQKNKEIRLKKSEEKFRTIIEMGGHGIFVLSPDAKITYCNERLAQMLGYLPEAIMGRSFFDLTDGSPPKGAQIGCNVEELVNTEDMALIKRDGGKMAVRISISRLKGESGRVNLAGIVSDLTQLKELEEDYRAVKEFNERIINSIPDSLIIIDPNNYRIIRANEQFLERMGMTSAEASQKTCYEIIHRRYTPCESYGIYCPVRETAIKNRSTLVNRVYHDNEGKERVLQITTLPLHDSTGKVNRVIRIGHEITYEHKIKEDPNLKKNVLEKVQNHLKTLHEILTHLGAMESFPKLIDYIYKISKRMYPGSDFLFFVLNAGRNSFYPLNTCDEAFVEPFQTVYAKLDHGGQLADLIIYLNKLKPYEIINIGNTGLPPPLRMVAEDYATSFGLPVFFQSQCIGYFLVVSNPAQEYAIEDIHFFHGLFIQLAGHIRNLVIRDTVNKRYVEQSANRTSFENIIGRSTEMQKIYNLIEQVANSDATVLITGENGTGKELVAQAIHRMGNRSNGPFVVANCAAFSSNLLESELFGHEKGSFTGAFARKKGRIELAHGGTLFLDEVGTISLDTQVLLLRFLQNHCFERVGGEQTIKADVRVLAASNRDLQQEVQIGRFRSDFFYRLNVITIHLPPLRERKEDIPLLAGHFLKNYSLLEGKTIGKFAPEIMQILMDFDWPGNIRQLENAIHHAVILAQSDAIQKNELPGFFAERPDNSSSDTLAENERLLILRVLRESNWNKHEAARKLEISRSTLYSKIDRYNLYKEELFEI